MEIATQRSLSELESVIERGMTTFVDVGTALMEIRDSLLYRQCHPTFEDYCEERWGFKRAHAYRMIEAATIARNVSPIGDTPLPVRESQVRELARVDPEHRAETWAAVVEEHGPKATANEVRSVVEARTWTPEPWSPIPPRDIEQVYAITTIKDSNPDETAALRFKHQLSGGLKHLSELVMLQPDAIAAYHKDDELSGLRVQIRLTREWFDAVERAIQPRGFRVVG